MTFRASARITVPLSHSLGQKSVSKVTPNFRSQTPSSPRGQRQPAFNDKDVRRELVLR